MFNLIVLNDSLVEISEYDMGSSRLYPDSEEIMLYIKNQDTEDINNVEISVAPAVSYQNFSTPALFTDVRIGDVRNPIYLRYMELLAIGDNKVVDLANFPSKELTPVIDPDGWCRNIINNIEIKFNTLALNGNGRIYISEAVYMSGVSKDVSGTPEAYQNKIKYDRILAGESHAFWVKNFLQANMDAEKNPFKFNLLIRGG